MTLEIKFLGPWQVLAGEEPVRFTGGRRIGVLARLALDAGQTVRATRILTDIWGDGSAATAAKQLHIVISKLRETLGPHTDGEIIQTMPGGYRLALDPDRVDAHLFGRLAKRARAAQAQGARGTADALFRTALKLWRGDPLAELTAPWARIEAARLDEEHHTVLEDHADLRLAAGDHHALAADLAAHVRAHPLRERPAAQLMLALHRAGRSSQALAVYRDIRHIMVAELGIEPSAALRRLHQAVLAKDPALDLTTPAQQVTLGEPYVPAELPADTHAFTARTAEIDCLREALDPVQGAAVTVIDGPGGIGKSALTIHVAHAVAARFTDGVIYLNLHGSTPGMDPLTPAQALRHLLRSLGLDGTAVPADPGEAAARYRSLTAACNLLVILDNARDVRQVRPLIPAGPGCRVLITSRDPLATLDHARHLHLGTLNAADAAELLSRLAGPGRVRAEPEAAERIVHLCDGLPLALRIAGARLAARPDRPLADLAARLADATRRLDVLEYADLAVRASIAVSHHHLHEDPVGNAAARLLPLLGLLGLPTHTPAVAAALTGWSLHRAEAALERLEDARLLESAGPDRYQLHDLVGLYARERAHQDLTEEERTAAVQGALHHYLTTVWAASTMLSDAGLRSPVEPPGTAFEDVAQAEGWIRAERDNLLAATRQALSGPDPATAVSLAIGLHWPFCYQGWHTQLADIYAQAIDAADRIGAWQDKAQLRSFLGWVHRDQGRYEPAIAELETALTDWDRAGLPRRKIGALNNLGVVNTIIGRLDEALACLESALELNDDAERPAAAATIRNNRVHVYYRQGRFEEAIAEARQVVDLSEKAAYPLADAGIAHGSLGDAYRHAGRLPEAAESYATAVRLLGESGYRLKEAVSRWWFGATLHGLGRHGEAREQWEHSVRLLRDARLLTPREATEILTQDVPETPHPIRHML
ncbi:BTAD domain-containing putative transcriptional regulator [[Actinomadura] parvosata]|uniref:BTAD domain-containing putative transcriptional regulator n=1 Tax=[Actinomadura] parvosata TaxID=1955412 RepID=UPI00406C53B0